MIREILDAMPAPSIPEIDETDRPLPNRLQLFGERMVDENLSRMAASQRGIDATARMMTLLYLSLFALGILAVVAGLVRGIIAQNAGGGLVMVGLAGLGAVAFSGTFALRPLPTLQRHAIFSCWLTATMNSYWTRLTHLSRSGPVEAEIKRATDDLISEMTTLLEKQGSPTTRRVTRIEPGTYRTTSPPSGQIWDVVGEARPRQAETITAGIEG